MNETNCKSVHLYDRTFDELLKIEKNKHIK